MLLYGVAILAGVVTAISPCAYPVLPIVFAAGATSAGSRRRPYAILAGLICTFLASLLFLTWLLSLLHIPDDFLRNVSIALLFVVGIGLMIPQIGRLLERPFTRLSRRPAGDLGGGFLLGAGLGLVFAPCAGTILAAVAGASATTAGVQRVALAFAYTIGVAVPLLLIAMAAQRGAERPSILRADIGRVRALLGAIIAAAAVLLAFGVDTSLQRLVPDYTQSLQAAERSCTIRSDLNQRCVAAHPGPGLKNYGQAPGFRDITAWINSKPLTISRLRGKVVLVDFWTYSCVNCLRTLPHLEAWYAKYHRTGLEIVGVHTPEFAFEHVVSNVRKATRELDVRYPVAVDDDAATWGAYQNSYWPAEYLIDRHGDIREIKEGEGDYDTTEAKIRELLGEQATTRYAAVPDTTPDHALMTPESYLGWQRLENYVGSRIVPGREKTYQFPLQVPPDSLAYAGRWTVGPQRIVAGKGARLRLNFLAQNVFLVLGGHGRVSVLVNGQPVRTVDVGGISRLYTLQRYPKERTGLLELHFTPGISAYAFTFG
ncbi:MAG TPA: cytochrome c biogenesis protein CcdA [Gaiellaceae bacterium]|nr:cytochrome c biogenesis protein CcdA [Gaiellaceae bacterium]